MRKVSGKVMCSALAVMMAASLAGCGKLDGTEVVATLNGDEITLGLASYVVRDTQAITEQYYQFYAQNGYSMGEMDWEEKDSDGLTAGETSKNQSLENIKQMYILKQHAADYDVTISDEEEEKIKEVAASFIAANDQSVLDELAVSEADIINYLELMTYQVKMKEPLNATADTEISDEEANQSTITYVPVSITTTEKDEDGNTINLTGDELEAKKEQAQEILDKLLDQDDIANADLDALAKEVDESLSAQTQSFTTADFSDDYLDDKLTEAALTVKDGEAYESVIEGESALYVVRLDKTLDEEKTESKKESILSERQSEAFDNQVDEWLEESDFQLNEKVWKKIKLTNDKTFSYKDNIMGQ